MRFFRGGPAEVPRTRTDSDPAAARFFLYFSDEETARAAQRELEGKGYTAQLSPPDDEVTQWEVLAGGVPDTEDLEAADRAFEKWASSLGGEYDGHEVAVGD